MKKALLILVLLGIFTSCDSNKGEIEPRAIDSKLVGEWVIEKFEYAEVSGQPTPSVQMNDCILQSSINFSSNKEVTWAPYNRVNGNCSMDTADNTPHSGSWKRFILTQFVRDTECDFEFTAAGETWTIKFLTQDTILMREKLDEEGVKDETTDQKMLTYKRK